MPLPYQRRRLKTSFATCSVASKTAPTLEQKVEAIKNAGFDGIELNMGDLVEYCRLKSGRDISDHDYDAIASVATQFKELVQSHDLQILMLQPFARFEGWSKSDENREDAFDRARGWIKVMEAVGTDMLQVGSTDAEAASTSVSDLASDLAQLADILAEKGLRVAYENWCWSTRAPTWKDVWQIVETANRPNLGLCLDTFQSAGGEWGDPTTKSGRIESVNRAELEGQWRSSLEELAWTVPADKIYLLQISDAYRMNPPMSPGKDENGDMPRSRWSRDYRPLPCNGGYLPVHEFLKAVLRTGFDGWLSIEVFDKQKSQTATTEGYTKGAIDSLEKLLSFV